MPGFVALGLCIALCGLSRMGGAIATQISVLAAIVAVVAVCYPQSPMGAMQLAGLFAAGAAWAMLICILAWPVDPFAPQKQACAAIFRELAHMAGRLPRAAMVQARPPASGAHHIISAYRRDIRTRIEQARALWPCSLPMPSPALPFPPPPKPPTVFLPPSWRWNMPPFHTRPRKRPAA